NKVRLLITTDLQDKFRPSSFSPPSPSSLLLSFSPSFFFFFPLFLSPFPPSSPPSLPPFFLPLLPLPSLFPLPPFSFS
ncbi:hypothetical protein ACXWR7_13590, partial [Streptococcus pyogenes]